MANLSSIDCIALEDKHGAHNYKPLPVVLSRGKGPLVWDVEGNDYYDLLAGYSAVNQGHCHPRICQVAKDQLEKITLTGRAFYNDQLGLTEKYLTEMFHYDKALMMNSGAEAVETAVKLARRWGYDKKGIPANQAIIVVVRENFHGRTSTVVSFSTDPEAYGGFGPQMAGFIHIDYDDAEALRSVLEKLGHKVAAFLVEPIQGEAGVIVPSNGYLKKVSEICKEHNVLFICDEIQAGLGRTGSMLACHHDNARPDVVLLGKALSGGVSPISCVLADDDVILCIKPGQHGSTFGGNPLACAIVRTALDVLVDENLCENARIRGEQLRARLGCLTTECGDIVDGIRGRGLMNALLIKPGAKFKAGHICHKLIKNGILAKQTHDDIIRLTPPLVVTEADIEEICDRIIKTFKTLC